MGMEFSGMRVTPCEVTTGQTIELDVTNIRSIVFAEMTRWGTSVGDVSARLGDMGDFFDPSPGDCLHGFFPVKRLVIRNNTIGTRKIVVILHESPDFRLFNTPRGV
jgi:hypothetical protein